MIMSILKRSFFQPYLWMATILCSVMVSGYVQATTTDIWNKEGVNRTAIDHSNWQMILDKYIKIQKLDKQPGINFFNYKTVSAKDRAILVGYLEKQQAIDPRDYSKKEQFAYWVNLYNALTIELILDNYPVKTITKIGPLLSFGPWDEDAAEVAGEVLTLNDIEHKILRPIWNDPRIHYAVNCASYSCPNLSQQAFTADNTESLLDQAAKDYVNHPRGVSFNGNRLMLSKIYKWYADDFGSSEQELLTHITQYAMPELAKQLNVFDGKITYDYDWRLNESK